MKRAEPSALVSRPWVQASGRSSAGCLLSLRMLDQ